MITVEGLLVGLCFIIFIISYFGIYYLVCREDIEYKTYISSYKKLETTFIYTIISSIIISICLALIYIFYYLTINYTGYVILTAIGISAFTLVIKFINKSLYKDRKNKNEETNNKNEEINMKYYAGSELRKEYVDKL